MRDEQFEFRPRNSTTLQLARLVGSINRNFDDRRLTASDFLDVAKSFDIVWDRGLLYKNFPYFLVKTVSLYLECQTFQTSFQSVTSTRDVTRAELAQNGLVSLVHFGLYVNEIPTLSRHVELAHCAEHDGCRQTAAVSAGLEYHYKLLEERRCALYYGR
jgi:hypothetical protein